MVLEVLVDVELQNLRERKVGAVKIKVIGKVMEIWNDFMGGIGDSLRTKASDQRVRQRTSA